MARLLLLSVIGAVLLWSHEPLSADSLYWASEQSDDIRSANLNGTDQKVVLTVGFFPTDLAIDGSAGQIYWTNNLLGTIGRADLNGTNQQTVFQANNFQNDPGSLALDIPANKMYWTNDAAEVIRANLDGSDPQVVLSVLNGSGDLALDLTHGKIYWTSQFGNTISDANLDGTDQQVLLSGLSEPSGIALDIASGKLYWTDWGGTIEDSNLDGSDRQTLLTGGAQGESGLALDLSNGNMYWTTWFSKNTLSTGQLWSAHLDGSGPEALISGLNEPVGISLLSEPTPPATPEPATSTLVAIGALGIIGCACLKGRVG